VGLTPKTLTQLFIASPNNSLAVHLHEGVPSVWGFLDAVPSSTLQLRVTGTGTLIASEDSAIIVALEKGEILLPDESGTTNWTALLAKNLSTSRPFQERYLLAHRIQAVALAMHRHGHGGTLVVTRKTRLNFAHSWSCWLRQTNRSCRISSPTSVILLVWMAPLLWILIYISTASARSFLALRSSLRC
jgi:hypothetical protein